jgi:hypothetical protein
MQGYELLDYIDWRLLTFVPLILWLLVRRRFKAAYEARLRRQGLLKEDEQLKGRFERGAKPSQEPEDKTPE